ncbi:MerR family transcriptional regulator [Streptomyces hainanensis]|uniref:MerR family transcriptional regulator n=1 Tax=Streptomyces hainanensis TaxID=402648 RepID=A0A4R4TP37_9ACTN|nr:MerR family transcriptional regulator [Streptomyces hainanensis]TDC75859.1 MerR family transcriptional regulator [Streptomyces hainanensis]
MHAPEAAEAPHQYRAAELAEAAGIPERTLRYYRERKLLPPPRRAGRVAWYDDGHLARLRTIAALLARGHTLGGIGELITAFTAGQDAGRTAELLGLTEPLPPSTAEPPPWAEERPVRLTRAELASYLPEGDSPENLAGLAGTGYAAVAGDEVVHLSRELLEATSELAKEGLPLSSLFAAGREIHAHADALADVFVDVLRAHVVPEMLGDGSGGARRRLSAEESARLTDVLDRLRPPTKRAVAAAISVALDRRLSAEVEPPAEG